MDNHRMHKYFRTTFAVAVAVGLVLPAAASAAEIRAVTGVGAQVRVGNETGAAASTSVRVQAQGQATGSSQQQAHEGQGNSQGNATATAATSGQERGNATATAAHERNLERATVRLDLWLGGTTTPVQSAVQLQQMIQARTQELEGAASSSASTTREALALRHSVGMSVAVHAFLASKDLLGTNVGTQVSQVAQQMNNVLATTTKAQLQIAERGFWTRLFFGGDTKAAGTITEAVAANEQHIQQLQQLLAQTNVSAQVKTQLTTQIQAMQQEQVRLSALAKQQASAWGILSWRF